jgi:choline dehydrogenase-like flavoprotein
MRNVIKNVCIMAYIGVKNQREKKMYDIAIIGGGPAGATLARLIGNKYKVLLLEKRTFQEPLYYGFQKCCGGLIDPDAQKMLASFGLGLPKSAILSPQMFAVRTIDNDNLNKDIQKDLVMPLKVHWHFPELFLRELNPGRICIKKIRLSYAEILC